MKGNKCTMVVSRRKLVLTIKYKIIWGDMCRKTHNRICFSFTPTNYISVTTIFRSKYLCIFKRIVVAVRPSEICAILQHQEFLSRQICILLLIVHLRKKLVQLVPPMLYSVQFASILIPSKCHSMPDSG